MKATNLLSSLLLLPATLLTTAAATADQNKVPITNSDKTTTLSVYTQPLNSAHSSKLASITYTYPSLNASVSDYTNPVFSPADDSVVRLGFYASSLHGADESAWHGTVTSQSALSDGPKKLKLYLDDKGDVWHLSYSSLPTTTTTTTTTKTTTAGHETLHVELVPLQKGPQPHLNKPIVLNNQGKPAADQEDQKSFLQKYA